MRKIIWIVLILLIAALGYIGYAHFSGGAVPTLGLPIGGDRALIREKVLTFFEQIKFKNRNALKRFVDAGVSDEELSLFLSKTLGAEADRIDLLSSHIKDVELDSQGLRARVKVELFGHNQDTNRPLLRDAVIFLYKASEKWLIDTKTLS